MNLRCLIKISTILTSLFLCINNCYCMNKIINQVSLNTNNKPTNNTMNKVNNPIQKSSSPAHFFDLTPINLDEFQEENFLWDPYIGTNETSENINPQEIYTQLDTLKQRFNNCDINLKNVISKIDTLNQRFNNCESNFKNIISKLDSITKEITEIKKNIQTNKNYNNTKISQQNNKLSTSVTTPIGQSTNIFPNKQSNTTIVQNNNKLLTNFNIQARRNISTLPVKSKTNDLSYSSTQISAQQPIQQYTRNQSVNYGSTYNMQASVHPQQQPNYPQNSTSLIPKYIPPSTVTPSNI